MNMKMTFRWLTLVFIFIMLATTHQENIDSFQKQINEIIEDGGWYTDPSERVAQPGPCTIKVEKASLTQQEFLNKYAYKEPLVIKGASNNEKFRLLTQRPALMDGYGHTTIRLSSANSYSYAKRDVTFHEYCDKHTHAQKLDSLGNETFYFFGDNNHEEWEDLLTLYNTPSYFLPKHHPALSFGLAGTGSGVPFHYHGPGFAETMWGRKRWFMYPPNTIPQFHPNRTTLQWLLEDYEKLKKDPKLTECTLEPGDIIYFPDKWWHATLNIDKSVFISTFLSPL